MQKICFFMHYLQKHFAIIFSMALKQYLVSFVTVQKKKTQKKLDSLYFVCTLLVVTLLILHAFFFFSFFSLTMFPLFVFALVMLFIYSLSNVSFSLSLCASLSFSLSIFLLSLHVCLSKKNSFIVFRSFFLDPCLCEGAESMLHATIKVFDNLNFLQ